MKKFLTPLVFLGALNAFAQSIGTVNTAPSNLTECTTVSYTITGSLPGNLGLTNFTSPLTGFTQTINLYAAAGGPADFPTQLTLAPYVAGTYTIVTKLWVNGAVVDTETIARVVGPAVNPDAGTNGAQTFCTSDPTIPLFSLLGGSPDPGGVWTDPTGTVVPGGNFDPGVGLPGVYTYLIAVQPPCVSDDAQVTISYLPNTNPGLPGQVPVCAIGGGPDLNLFLYLQNMPQAGGTWTKPGGGAHSGTYVPATDPIGVYTYTIVGLPPCGNPSSTVTLQPVPETDAGQGSAAFACYNDVSIELASFVTGTPSPDGDWYNPIGTIIGPLTTVINATVDPAGLYEYVVYGSICPNDTALVDLTYIQPPCTPGFEEFLGNVSSFEVMPNPTEGLVTLELELYSAAGRQQLDVLDVNGVVVLSQVLAGNGTWYRNDIDLGGLAKGAYVLRVTSADGLAVQRVLVL